jgi:hypothetical protein
MMMDLVVIEDHVHAGEWRVGISIVTAGAT